MANGYQPKPCEECCFQRLENNPSPGRYSIGITVGGRFEGSYEARSVVVPAEEFRGAARTLRDEGSCRLGNNGHTVEISTIPSGFRVSIGDPNSGVDRVCECPNARERILSLGAE